MEPHRLNKVVCYPENPLEPCEIRKALALRVANAVEKVYAVKAQHEEAKERRAANTAELLGSQRSIKRIMSRRGGIVWRHFDQRGK